MYLALCTSPKLNSMTIYCYFNIWLILLPRARIWPDVNCMYLDTVVQLLARSFH